MHRRLALSHAHLPVTSNECRQNTPSLTALCFLLLRGHVVPRVTVMKQRDCLHYPAGCSLLCNHVTSCSTVCFTHSETPSQGDDAHWPRSLEIPLGHPLRPKNIHYITGDMQSTGSTECSCIEWVYMIMSCLQFTCSFSPCQSP